MDIERVQARATLCVQQPFRSSWREQFIVFAIVVFGMSLAAADASTTKTKFDIEAQAAKTSLTLYARQAHVQLGFASDIVDDILTNPVKGEYENAQALEILLKGTGLEAEHGERGIIIRRIPKRVVTSGIEEPAPDLTETNSLRLTQTAAQAASQTSTGSAGNTTSEESEKAAKKLEEIVVTGSRIRGAQSAVPVITITRDDIDKSGFATVEQLVSSWPQNFGGGATQENFTDHFSSQEVRQFTGSEVSIDLRGLGSDATLVLVNGRRMAAGGLLGEFTNISSIPLTAIERIEVLTDGASAIYGADAVGGVVNFILLDKYEGAESRLQIGPDFGADTTDVRFGQLFGKSWPTGNLLFSYEYYEQDNLDSADRAQAANSDLRSLGGDNFSQVGGNPGHIIVGGQTYAIPRGQDGTSLTVADFVGLEGTQNFKNDREGIDLRGEQKRHTVFLNFRQEFADSVEYFLETRYTKNDVTSRTFRGGLDLDVPDSNPFFVDPTGTGLTTIRIEDYSFFRDIGPVLTDGETETYGGTTGVLFDLGASSWEAEFSGSYATERSASLRSNAANPNVVADALAESDPDRAFNPFADGSNTNPAVLATIPICCTGSEVETDFFSLNADFSGRIFELHSGPISVATGLEYRRESIKGAARDTVSVTPGIDSDREVAAAYAELFVPLVSPRAGRPGLERLEFSIAGRYVNYSDFGDNVSPRIGIVWSPSKSLNLRGTFGESFKPPLLTELDTSNPTENLDTYFGFTLVPAIFRFGGNPDLKPEGATTLTAGIQIAPQSVSGLNVDLTYFEIEFEDRILVINAGLNGVFDPEFAPLVNLTPTQEEIIAIASSSRYRNFGTSADDITNGVVPVGAIVDFRRQNFAKWEVSGLDFQFSYGFDSEAGRIDLGLSGSYLFEIDQQLLATLPSLDLIDTVGNPVDFRARGSLSWTKGQWGISGFLNYTDSYADDDSDPQRSVDSWTTVDLQLTYDTHERRTMRWLDHVRFSLSIQNLFNEDPPFVNRDGGLGFDPANASVFGQAINLQAIKTWE